MIQSRNSGEYQRGCCIEQCSIMFIPDTYQLIKHCFEKPVITLFPTRVSE